MVSGTNTKWFNVFVMIGDPVVGHQAYQLFQRFINRFDRDFLFAQHMLLLDRLAWPEEADQAREHVAQADMIILAIRNEAHLTDEFRRWAQSWKIDHPCLFLAMLGDPPPSDAQEETPFLRELACAKGLDFMNNHSEEISQGDPQRNAFQRIIVPFLQSTTRREAAVMMAGTTGHGGTA